jgi:serine/threonine-protein kinase
MAPEQARGEVEAIDKRADVFALGSILCEILTGHPAFTGRGSAEILRKAERGDTADARARLDGCGADAELISLAWDCLAAEPADRPLHVGVVRARVTAYLAGVQERLRAAEIERARAEARAVEERKRSKWQLGLAASVLVLAVLSGVGATWAILQQAERRGQIGLLLDRAATALDRAEAATDSAAAESEEARARLALDQAGPLIAGTSDLAVAARLRSLQKRAKRAEAFRKLVVRLEAIRGDRSEHWDPAWADRAYAKAIRDFGLPLDDIGLPLNQADGQSFGPALAGHPVSVEIAAALDDWDNELRRSAPGPRGEWRRWIVEAAQVADPDEWRGNLRLLVGRPVGEVRDALRRLADETNTLESQPATSLILLAGALRHAGDAARAAGVLRSARRRFPGDFWVNLNLADHLAKARNTRDRADKYWTEALRYGTAAVAIRPQSYIARYDLGEALREAGDPSAAIVELREAIRLAPNSELTQLARRQLGLTLHLTGDRDAAIAELREAIRLEYDDPTAHGLLGWVLQAAGDRDAAIAELREAIRLVHKLDSGLRPRGLAVFHRHIGESLLDSDLDAAIRELREAIRLDPEEPVHHNNLAAALVDAGDLKAAIDEFGKAISLNPNSAEAHYNLGRALRQVGDFTGSLVALRRGHELGSKQPGWSYPSAQWVRRAEQSAPLANRLQAVLRGEAQPANNAERLTLAYMCYDTKRHTVAARLWDEALKADPSLGDDYRKRHRYHAACAAALAAAGRGEGDSKLDGAAKEELRRKALGWLKADLGAWSKALETDDPKARDTVGRVLRYSRQDSDLAGVRDSDALAVLPDQERADWRAFWADVDRLLQQVGKVP